MSHQTENQNWENSTPSQTGEMNLENISSILWETENVQKSPEEDVLSSLSSPQIFDINIVKIADIVKIIAEKKYDFAVLEPQDTEVKVIFKKNSVVTESRNIRFPVYANILLETKKSCWLQLEETTSEQKWVWKIQVENTHYELIAKTVPSPLWEQIFIKIKTPEVPAQVVPKKSSMDTKTALTFLSVVFIIALIIWWGFLGFIVFNAKTLQDVSLFYSLGINLNQINSFLLTSSRIVFSILVFLQTIFLIIFLFKAFLTKKEFKRKKIIATIASVFFFIMTFSTATAWLAIDKKIQSLPDWLELSYGNVQVFDNTLLSSENFNKEAALLTDFTSLVGPIEIKFDLTNYSTDQTRQGFTIQRYIWSFNNKEEESNDNFFIKNFDEKGITNIALKVVWVDRTGKTLEKVVTDVPNSISIASVVKIEEKTIANWGKIYIFDASELKNLGKIEWYTKENPTTPAYVWEKFQPSKIYFDESMVWMIIRNTQKEDNTFDKIFMIRGTSNQIAWDIEAQVSLDDDLQYEFSVKDLEMGSGDGFVESFTWVIEGKENTLKAKIDELEASSKFSYTFTTYGKQSIRVKITNTKWQVKEILKEVNIPKRLNISNQISILNNGSEVTDMTYEEKTGDYFLSNIWSPTKLSFDARAIKADNLLYSLDEITWDLDSDGDVDQKGKTFDYTINADGSYSITVNYVFVHRRNKEDVINMSQRIYIEASEKEAILSLNIKPDSEYAPANVVFDASESKVKDDNIVKFVYDYGDGIVEERDALNLGHRYLKEGNYIVKLTVVTQKGKEYTTSKNLVLKPQATTVSMSSSLSRAPVGQEISFFSAGTQWQITRYYWDFGDGFSSTEANPSYAYKAPGKYSVTLTLDFINNNTLSEKLEVEIYENEE